MATKKTTAVEENTATGTDVSVPETTYKIEALRKHCRKLFGVSLATFAGAIAGIEDREYTIEEMKTIIKKWCGQEVK